MPADPPSFEPKGPRPQRPDGAKAHPVRPEETPPTRVMPGAGQGGQQQPPSYSPGGQSTHPQQPRRPQQPHQPHHQQGQPPQYQQDYPGQPPYGPPPAPARPPRRRKRRRGLKVMLFILVLLLAWPIGLGIWANSKLNHVDALSGAADTPGTTYLLAGSDSREGLEKGDAGFDQTEGARTDTILLLHVPKSGSSSLISLPRDSYVDIPGYQPSKLNAAYSWGGPELLVETVEELSGFTVDHYVEVGFSGITGIVDELDGVELCHDEDVSDEKSKLEWSAGCHEADGETALAFARMRYADKEGDLGRTDRQRQLISSITSEAASPGVLLNPKRQLGMTKAATGSLKVDNDANIIDLARLAWAFRKASGSDGWSGTPPIATQNFRPGGVGSAVQLDEAELPAFFEGVANGNPPNTEE